MTRQAVKRVGSLNPSGDKIYYTSTFYNWLFSEKDPFFYKVLRQNERDNERPKGFPVVLSLSLFKKIGPCPWVYSDYTFSLPFRFLPRHYVYVSGCYWLLKQEGSLRRGQNLHKHGAEKGNVCTESSVEIEIAILGRSYYWKEFRGSGRRGTRFAESTKSKSVEPDSNQRPKDTRSDYSPPLYQLSYRRHVHLPLITRLHINIQHHGCIIQLTIYPGPEKRGKIWWSSQRGLRCWRV